VTQQLSAPSGSTDPLPPAYRESFHEADGYLNFARFGPPSRDALDAVAGVLREASGAGAGTMEAIRGAERRPLHEVAELVGRSAADVTAVTSTGTGLFHVAMGLRGAVALSPTEFPANVYPWRRAEALGRLQVVEVPTKDGRVTVDSLRRVVDRVDALAVSAVDFRTGYRADLAGLRDVLGERLLVVDAIQAFGAVDAPWEVADVVVAGAQKWLRAGWGTGFMAVSAHARDRLEPVLTGWTGVRDHDVFDAQLHAPREDAGRFAVSGTSPVADAALRAATGLLRAAGPAAVEEALQRNVDTVVETVLRRGGTVLSPVERTSRAGIVVASLPRPPDEVSAALVRGGVAATCRDGLVRISPHATTSTTTMQMLDAALACV